MQKVAVINQATLDLLIEATEKRLEAEKAQRP